MISTGFNYVTTMSSQKNMEYHSLIHFHSGIAAHLHPCLTGLSDFPLCAHLALFNLEFVFNPDCMSVEDAHLMVK